MGELDKLRKQIGRIPQSQRSTHRRIKECLVSIVNELERYLPEEVPDENPVLTGDEELLADENDENPGDLVPPVGIEDATDEPEKTKKPPKPKTSAADIAEALKGTK